MGSGASAHDLEPFRDAGGRVAPAQSLGGSGVRIAAAAEGGVARARGPAPQPFAEPGGACVACAELDGRWAAAGPSQKGAWLRGPRAGFAGKRAMGWLRMLVEAGLFLCCVVLFPRPVVF